MVSTMFNLPVLVYLVGNTFAMIIYGLDFKFKGEKGILRVLKKIMMFWPLFVTIMIAWLLKLKMSFVGEVCLGGYSEIMKTKIARDRN